MQRNPLISWFAVGSLTLSFSTVDLVYQNCVQAEPSPQKTETSDPVQLLFVQNAVSGAFDGKTLILKGIGPTIFFSDRPERISGQVRTSEFISHWDKGSDNFAANPPNATLSLLNETGVESIVIELSEPKLEDNTLSYTVKVLQGKLPATFKESSLFIDILGRWRMFAYGAAAGAAVAGTANYYYHPAVVPYAPVAVPPVVPAVPMTTPQPIYLAPRPIVVY